MTKGWVHIGNRYINMAHVAEILITDQRARVLMVNNHSVDFWDDEREAMLTWLKSCVAVEIELMYG